MISINKLISTIFLIFVLLFFTPTLIFLTKSYYANIMIKKTYVGIIDLPDYIEKSEDTISSARALFSSPDIRAIILKCNSAGGNEGSCQSIYYDILKLKSLYKKPIVAYIEQGCFAGAYLIAAASDYIVASPGAIIGHLGTFYLDNDVNEIVEDSSFVLDEIETPVKAKIKNKTRKETIKRMPSLKDQQILKKELKKQYFEILKTARKDCSYNLDKILNENYINGEIALKDGLVDSLGGMLAVESLLRKTTVIEGQLQEVYGSIAEHFIVSLSGMINKVIKGAK